MSSQITYYLNYETCKLRHFRVTRIDRGVVFSIVFLILSCILFFTFETVGHLTLYATVNKESAFVDNELDSSIYEDLIDIKKKPKSILMQELNNDKALAAWHAGTIEKLQKLRIHNVLRGIRRVQSETTTSANNEHSEHNVINSTIYFDQASDLEKIKQRVLKWEESSN